MAKKTEPEMTEQQARDLEEHERMLAEDAVPDPNIGSEEGM